MKIVAGFGGDPGGSYPIFPSVPSVAVLLPRCFCLVASLFRGRRVECLTLLPVTVARRTEQRVLKTKVSSSQNGLRRRQSVKSEYPIVT